MTIEIAHYKCNDNAASKVVTDAMAAYNGTASVNTTELSVAGKILQAFQFNGSGEHIDLGASFPVEGTFTIAFWFVNKGTNKVAYMWCRNTTADAWGQVGIVYESSNLKVSGGAIPGQTACSYASITNGDHFAFVFSGNTNCKVYKNGNSTAIANLTIGDTTVQTGTPRTAIGRAGAYNGYFFDGILDDIRYYSVALSTSEIAAIYNSGSGTEATLPPTYTITGTCKDAGGTNIAGVVVSDGTRSSAPSAADGTYTIAAVPNGTYTLTATLTDYTFVPNGWTNDVTVSGANLTGKDWTGTFVLHGLEIGGFNSIRGSVDNVLDIGTSTKECKDGYFDGTVNIDTLIADTLAVDTNTLITDATNNRVGIGITSPTSDLHVSKTGGATFKVESLTNGNVNFYLNALGGSVYPGFTALSEVWFNFNVTNATTGSRYWRMGKNDWAGSGFSIHGLNDAGGAITNQAFRVNNSDIFWNETYLDMNFTLYKKTSGSAYVYDSGLGTHTWSGNGLYGGNLNFADNNKVILGTGLDVEFYYDGTDTQLKNDIVAPSDMHIDCGTDKTIVLDETVWDDCLPYSVNPGTGLTALTIADYGTTGFRMNQWSNNVAANEEIQCYFQLPHSYKQGTDLSLHIHYVASGNGATGASAVEFNLAYQWVNVASAYSSAANVTSNQTFIIGTADNGVHNLWDFTHLSGTGKIVSSDVMVKIKRLTNVADRVNDNYPGPVWLRYVDIHFEKDTIGSRQELSK